MFVGICDVRISVINDIKAAISSYSADRDCENIVYAASSISNLLKVCPSPDIAYIGDSNVADSCIESGKELSVHNPSTKIVILSNNIGNAYAAFGINAFRFHSYPIRKSDIYRDLDDLSKTVYRNSYITVKENELYKRIPYDQIIYVKAVRNGSEIVTKNCRIITSSYVSDIEKKTDSTHFMRVHRSYFINFSHVLSFVDKSVIIMDNGDKIYVSRRKRTSFIKNYNSYVKGFERKIQK